MLKLENNYIKISLNDGVYYAHYKPIVVNLRIAKEIVKQRQSVTLGKSCPFVVDVRDIKGVNVAAVKYLSSDLAIDDIHRLAVIIKSNLIAKLANLFYRIVTPKIPTKLFSSEEDAKNWINNIKKENIRTEILDTQCKHCKQVGNWQIIMNELICSDCLKPLKVLAK